MKTSIHRIHCCFERLILLGLLWATAGQLTRGAEYLGAGDLLRKVQEQSSKKVVAEDQEERVSGLPEGTAKRKGRVALPLTVLVNPKLEPEGDEQVTFYEGCLSVRGYGALVPRWRAVRVSGVDAEGRPVALRLEGWPARIMQHELDHLNGTLYVDRMLTRSFATDAELPRLGNMAVDDAKRELGIDLEPG